MAPIRVLQCVAGLGHGGYESLLMNLYRHTDTRLVQFDFLSSFPGVYEQEIEARGGRIHRIPFITQKGPFVYGRELGRVLAAHPEYRILHSHMDKFSGLLMRKARRAGVPVRIAHSHNTQNEGGLAFQLVKNYYGRMVLPNATQLFACSQAAADWMFGPAAPRAHILRNGVDPERFAVDPATRAAVRAELGLGPEAPVFGHVGRFTPQKNHAFLLDVFAAVAARAPGAALVLAGTGPLEEEMRAKAAALGLAGRVRFLGPRQDVPRLLQALDCFLFPSLHEGLPVTLVEAQAAGLPVIASAAITPEVCITPLVRLLPLAEPPAAWAGAALAAAQAARAHRASPAGALEAAGYDIRAAAAWLQQFYLEQAALAGRESGPAARR